MSDSIDLAGLLAGLSLVASRNEWIDSLQAKVYAHGVYLDCIFEHLGRDNGTDARLERKESIDS